MTETLNYIETSVVTCPACDHAAREVMPLDACIFTYACPACGHELRATDGRCIYCAYGSVTCPPVQIAEAGGEPAHCCTGPKHEARNDERERPGAG